MVACITGCVKGQPRCKEHDSPAHYVLETKDAQIALCPVCVEELKKSLGELRDCYGNNKTRRETY